MIPEMMRTGTRVEIKADSEEEVPWEEPTFLSWL
jgi:hypothetical protein